MIASGLEAKLLAAQAESGAANLRRAIAFAAVEGPLELQALGVRDRPGSQYDATKAAHALTTDDGVRLAAEAEKWSAQGVYILPATLRPGVETRHSAPGSWYTIPKRGGTADSDIAARQVLAIDLDVDRPTNTSATDAEMALSVAVACRALEYLAPVVGADSLAYVHSGNGRQVWLALDSLPVSSEVKALLAAVLAGLASLLDTPSVHVDLTLVDAKRILPACGTTKKKGAPGIPDRPHRRTAIVTPEHVNRLSEVSLRRLLERLRQDCGADGCAAIDKALGVRPEKPRPATTAGTATGARPFEAANKLDPTQVAQWLGLLDGDHPRCPGCGEADSGVAILDHGFKCSHNRCQHLGRQGFRTAVDLTMEVRGLNKFEAVNALAESFGFDPLPAWDPSRSKANGANGHGSNGAAFAVPPDDPTAQLEDPGFDPGPDDEPDDGEDADAWRELVTLAPVEWFTTPPPARTWLLRDSRPEKSPGLLPLGKAGMLVAEGGAGKTMLLCQLAIAVATGTPFLGCFTVATRGRVLLVLGEEDATEAHRRLYNASRTGTPTPPEESIAVLPLAGRPCAMLERDECGNPVDTPFALSLSAYVDAERVAGRPFVLVVLDPLSRFAGPDAETDNATATRFVQSVERLATPDTTTALVSHHNAKAWRGRSDVATADARGSSAFGDGLRWVAALTPADVRKALEDPDERERLGELVTLAVTKSNYGRKGDPVPLRRDPDRNGALVPLDDDDRARVEAARKAPSVARETAKADTRGEAFDADDAAAREAWIANPGASKRTVTAVVQKARKCGRDRAFAAVSRTRPA